MRGDLGIAIHAELHDEAFDGTEEGVVVVVVFGDEFIEMIRAQRRPVMMNLNYDVALGGFEFHFVFGRDGRLGRLLRRGFFGGGRGDSPASQGAGSK